MVRMDNVSPEVRSRTMRAVRARDTSAEIALRRLLRDHRLLGYRISPAKVTGRPDVAYLGFKLAIFVDGCYWHGCPVHCRLPATNAAYWRSKVTRNAERDRIYTTRLQDTGWVVLRFWEHELLSSAPAVLQRVQHAYTDRRTCKVTRRLGSAPATQ